VALRLPRPAPRAWLGCWRGRWPTRAPATAQVRKRKWESYSSGEELFGLKVTPYPELEQTEKEINMLDRLYT
jgi:hypothetical protein